MCDACQDNWLKSVKEDGKNEKEKRRTKHDEVEREDEYRGRKKEKDRKLCLSVNLPFSSDWS